MNYAAEHPRCVCVYRCTSSAAQHTPLFLQSGSSLPHTAMIFLWTIGSTRVCAVCAVCLFRCRQNTSQQTRHPRSSLHTKKHTFRAQMMRMPLFVQHRHSEFCLQHRLEDILCSFCSAWDGAFFLSFRIYLLFMHSTHSRSVILFSFVLMLYM